MVSAEIKSERESFAKSGGRKWLSTERRRNFQFVIDGQPKTGGTGATSERWWWWSPTHLLRRVKPKKKKKKICLLSGGDS